MFVTAQKTTHIEYSFNVVLEGLTFVSTSVVEPISASVSPSSRLQGVDAGVPLVFARRTAKISARQVLARLRRLPVSSAEQNRSTRVRSAKIHRMCTSVGA